MDLALQNKIVSFIWSIADDCLRDVYVRGKYRDVILPMFVLRRLDCLLEETKEAVLEEVRFQREEAGFTTLDSIALKEASGYVFYNTSDWTLTRLVKTATNNRQILNANFNAYLDGFSDNVKEIISKFDLRSQIRRMVEADILLDVLEKFTSLGELRKLPIVVPSCEEQQGIIRDCQTVLGLYQRIADTECQIKKLDSNVWPMSLTGSL